MNNKVLIDENVLNNLILKALPPEYEVLLYDDALSDDEKEYYYNILLILDGQVNEVRKWVSSDEFKEIMDNVESLPLNFFDDFKIKMRVFLTDKFEVLLLPLLLGFYKESNELTYASLNQKQVFTDNDLLNFIEVRQYNYDLLTNLCDDLDKNFKEIILNGVIQGKDINDISQELQEAGINPLNRHTAQQRAKMIARTEVNSIKQKAKLQAYKDNNIKWINFNTMGDNRVCQDCINLEMNNPYQIDESWDIIPVHPNCRCYWTVSNKNYDFNTEYEY